MLFATVGFAYNMWENQPSGEIMYASDIVAPYTQFYPTLVLSLAIAATVLITYMEKDSYSFIFAGMGFAVLAPDIYKYIFLNGRADLALLGCALWAVLFVIWAFIWKDHTMSETTLSEKIMTSLKATFISYPIYLFTAIIAVFGESPRGIDAGALSGIANSIPDIIMFILVTIWLYFLVNIIIVSLMFVAHDLILHLLNYRRVVSKKGIIYEKIPSASAIAAAATRPRVNHYAGLMSEMDLFSKNIGEVDRIKAASTIGRFKSEYQTLAAKYNGDDKTDAEKMIKNIEIEFMKKY
ncbi:MAG TPA: hypothetical protein VMC84_12420 [Methanocella sp.]|uniref:hypothetical protein n=1 Tax=Methanocella sp. TaxID=2052833 RepID=UPI002B6AA5A5|nr:hypothetical protein [Methanocella sp.]HTY91972.1 hypothetical protein [Methanocella sp.]